MNLWFWGDKLYSSFKNQLSLSRFCNPVHWNSIQSIFGASAWTDEKSPEIDVICCRKLNNLSYSVSIFILTSKCKVASLLNKVTEFIFLCFIVNWSMITEFTMVYMADNKCFTKCSLQICFRMHPLHAPNPTARA